MIMFHTQYVNNYPVVAELQATRYEVATSIVVCDRGQGIADRYAVWYLQYWEQKPDASNGVYTNSYATALSVAAQRAADGERSVRYGVERYTGHFPNGEPIYGVTDLDNGGDWTRDAAGKAFKYPAAVARDVARALNASSK